MKHGHEVLAMMQGKAYTEEGLLKAIIEQIREVMRWAGPRMIWYAPKDAIRHILKK